MSDPIENIDWQVELQNLVQLSKTPDQRVAAFAFANAISPYLDDPSMLKTLLGKITPTPENVIGVVVKQQTFNSLADVQTAVGATVKVYPL